MKKRTVILHANLNYKHINRRVTCITTLLMMITLFTGCATFRGVENKGIPYYLPKPYLLVTKNVAVVQPTIPTAPKPKTANKKAKKDDCKNININCDPTPTPAPTPPSNTTPDKPTKKPTYAFQVIYLPDLGKERHIKMSAGLGSMTATFALANGWQFGGASVSLDSKTTENITAIGNAVGSLASLATTSAGESGSGLLDTAAKFLDLLGKTDGSIARINKKNLFLSDTQVPPLTPQQQIIKKDIDEQTKFKKRLEKLLDRLEKELEQLKPGIWLFDMIWDESCKCIRFPLVEQFAPFTFEKKPQHGHYHQNWGRCRCGKHH